MTKLTENLYGGLPAEKTRPLTFDRPSGGPSQWLEDESLLRFLNIPGKQPSGFIPGKHIPQIPASDQLRAWVLEWIESGRNEQGVETPKDRSWDKAPGALAALCDARVRLSPHKSFVSVWLPDASRLWSGGPQNQREAATHILAMIATTPIRYLIANCLDCAVYFMLSGRRSSYKNGTRCPDCYRSKRGESTAGLMERGRVEERTRLYALVAKHFRKNVAERDWHKDKVLVGRIVDFLREHSISVTSKWVVRAENREGITAATSRKVNAQP